MKIVIRDNNDVAIKDRLIRWKEFFDAKLDNDTSSAAESLVAISLLFQKKSFDS